MELTNMNIYTIAFPFKGEYHYVNVTANQISLTLLLDICGDALADHMSDNKEWMTYRFTIDTKHYMATFAINNPLSISVYEYSGNPDDDDYDEILVEDKIPYHVIKIDSGGEMIYDLALNV